MLLVVDTIRVELVIDRLEHVSCVVRWIIGQRTVHVIMVMEVVAVEVSRISRILQVESSH